jgi:cell division protein FtsB
MAIGQYNPRQRYRERSVRRVNAAILFLLAIGSMSVIAFWMGRQYAALQLDSLKKQVEESNTQLASLQEEVVKVRAEAQTATSRLEQLHQQYQKDLPEGGPIRALYDQLREQLADGMDPDRLAFVLRSARPPSNCTDPVSKRFMVKTPAYSGPESTVSVGEGAVIVSGIGASSHNKSGQPQAWFDATQPVTVTFKVAGGAAEQKSGVLPIKHSMIAAGREYRFTLSEGEKSFIKVTFDSCDYP